MTERYDKPPYLQADWDSLGTPSDPGFFDRLARARLENVVTARRLYGERTNGYRIDEVLVNRVEPRVTAEASKLASGHGSFYRLEIEEEILDEFWLDILGGESFFEVAFNVALHRVGQTAARKVLEGKQRKRERTASRVSPGGEVGGETDDTPEDDPVPQKELGYEDTGFRQLEDREILRPALARMPADVAKAMILAFEIDLKICSNDLKEVTVASELGCSERKARELIANGRELMAGLLEGEFRDEQ